MQNGIDDRRCRLQIPSGGEPCSPASMTRAFRYQHLARWIRRSGSFLMGASLALCVACKSEGAPAAGSSTSGEQPQLAFITNNSSEFWKIAAAGIRKYEQESKVQV